jgi:predicted unusual protein kinase regulating ubiquinone biosynthesis (AarF/ABC1/UbiB family)
MGWPFVRRRMAAELGPDWPARFESFEQEAAAAASLGQVHRAVTKDGRRVACKLQYPDMASAVEADLGQLDLAFAIYRRADRAIDASEMKGEIAARLREELDYRQEARHIALYRIMLAERPEIAVPEVLPELSTGRLLTMSWLDGRPLLDFKRDTLERRNAVAANMFAAWWLPFVRYGAIHGDPHLGNYTVRDDLGINLLDYGCIRTFRPGFVGGVVGLYRALLTDDRAGQVAAYEARAAAHGDATWRPPRFAPATHDEIEGLAAHAERTFVAMRFLHPEMPRRLMPRLRRLFARSGLEKEEVSILRGVLARIDQLVGRSR